MSARYCVAWLNDGIATRESYGNHLQRVQRPCELFAGDAEFSVEPLVIHDPDASHQALSADLLVVINVGVFPVADLIRQRRRLGRPTVFELNDDLGHVGDWLPPGSPAYSPMLRQNLLNAAHLSEVLQLSSPGLARRYAAVNANRYVLEPQVPVPERMPEKPPGFVIGWAGTNTHRDDLLAIAPALAAFLRGHPDARFALMGDTEYLRPFIEQLPPSRVDTRPFGSYGQLQDFLAGLHVGLAPLADNGFNRGRSDGKFAIYSAAGAASLLSDCPVFADHADRALLFGNAEKMRDSLAMLYADRDELAALARRAFDWVRDTRSVASVREQLRLQFRRLLGDRTPLPMDDDAPASEPIKALWSQARSAARESRSEDSIALCRDILKQDPTCQPARLQASQLLHSLRRNDEALLLIDSAPADTIFDDAFAALGYQISRHEQYRQRIQSPALLARIAAADIADAETRYRQLLQHAPYDYFALFALIALLRQRQLYSAELAELFARADLLAPQSVSTQSS